MNQRTGCGKKIAYLLAGFIAVAVISGISGDSQPDEITTRAAPPETTTTTTEPTFDTIITTTTAAEWDEREIELAAWRLTVAERIPGVMDVEDSDIEPVIDSVCELADDANGNATTFGVGLLLLSNDSVFTVEQLGAMVGASIGLDCPEHEALLDDLAELGS